MRFLLPAVVLLLSPPAFAQTVKLPESVKVEPGRLGAIRIEYDGDDLKWFVAPELDVFREFSVDPKDVRLRVQGFKPGRFQVLAVTCKAGKLSDLFVCWVFVGDPTPVPTPPDPKPPAPPTPPVPPTPEPPKPPPLPADPVAGRLADAFKADASPQADKVRGCQTLSAFFTAMAAHVRQSDMKKDDKGNSVVVFSVNSVGDLLSDYVEAGKALLKPDEIKGIRRQIATEVSGVVGTDATKQISPDFRETLAKFFELLAAILKLLS